MRSVLTKTQRDALRALHDAGGEGAMLPRGVVLAQGRILASSYEDEHGTEPAYGCAYIRSTWRRLRDLGMIESAGTGRIRISRKGADYV